jgi:predicted Fe-Mo cluster-binding NifX family protein
MSPDVSPAPSIIIGVPIYGNRVLPRVGAAREFLLASVQRGTAQIQSVQTCRWGASPPEEIGPWLRGLGAEGVICGGIHPRFQVALEAEGLWVLWGQRGPADEVLRRWACGELSLPETRSCPSRRHRCHGRGRPTRRAQGLEEKEVWR